MKAKLTILCENSVGVPLGTGGLRWKKLLARLETQIAAQPEVAAGFKKDNQLPEKKVIALADQWKRYPIARYFSLSRATR